MSAYLHPLKIGGVTLAHNIVFGPMAGFSDLPFRLLCHEQGSALGVTELISAKAITFRNKNTAAMLQTHPEEGTVAVQLFGHEPEVFAEAVRRMGELEDGSSGFSRDDKDTRDNRGVRYDILDINMGCPVPKVVGNGEGSALMKDPRLIEEIVRACVSAVKQDEAGTAFRPVTVKMRSGFDTEHVNAVECALAAEAGGASAVTVHARTRDRMYSGKADWRIIRAVKEAVNIPVIGNGDVTDGKSAKAMMEETGCDGVMVARGAQGNPWIFREILHYLETGEEKENPSAEEKLQMVERHLELLTAYKGEYTAVREMRGHLAHYTKGMQGAARMREAVNTTDNSVALREACRRFFRYKSAP